MRRPLNLSKKPYGLLRQRSCMTAAPPQPSCKVSFPPRMSPEMTDSILFPPRAAETLRGFLRITGLFDSLGVRPI